ncbi:MAG: RnfABCDGE type electron transport complex subunit D [Pseudomonadota bacterium]
MASQALLTRTHRRPWSSGSLMWLTVALLLPGVLVQSALLGAATLLHVCLAITLAVILEGMYTGRLWAPQTAWIRRLDGAAALTGALVALALPPATPIAITLVAVALALGLGKYAYGGLGNNPFNPAMVGYALVLVSFPDVLADGSVIAAVTLDALSGATPLDAAAHRSASTWAEFETTAAVGMFGGARWEWINAGFLAGGVGLLALRICHWRVPVAVLLGVTATAFLLHDNGSSRSAGSPLFHLFSGSTMLCAWFIATDPVSQPSHPRAQWLFGLLIGTLIVLIRGFGSWPDGTAFAVLLANGAAPWLHILCLRADERRSQHGDQHRSQRRGQCAENEPQPTAPVESEPR